MIVDSSALIAILRNESDAPQYTCAIERDPHRYISAVNYLEAAIVIDSNRDPIASRRFNDLIEEAQIKVEAVTEAQAKIAREAYRDFGRGSGHAAKLNFGDCFAYALAKDKCEPLLFKGNDFIHSDIEQVSLNPFS